jgi:outer membrane protein
LKKNLVPFSLLAIACAALMQAQAPAPAATPSKVATIHIQSAIMNTTAGKKAAGDLSAKFAGRKQDIEKKQAEVVGYQEQLKRGSATMNQDTHDKLARDIDSGQKMLQRLGEDFDADLQQDEGRIMQDLGQKMMDIIIKHATMNGFAMVIDVSNPQTPVLWADPSADITQEIVKQYDAAHPSAAPAPAAKPPAAAPKQSTPPPPAGKKQ